MGEFPESGSYAQYCSGEHECQSGKRGPNNQGLSSISPSKCFQRFTARATRTRCRRDPQRVTRPYASERSEGHGRQHASHDRPADRGPALTGADLIDCLKKTLTRGTEETLSDKELAIRLGLTELTMRAWRQRTELKAH